MQWPGGAQMTSHCLHTENKRLSIWQLCCHWWHCKLSLWQLTVPPVTMKLSNWLFLFSKNQQQPTSLMHTSFTRFYWIIEGHTGVFSMVQAGYILICREWAQWCHQAKMLYIYIYLTVFDCLYQKFRKMTKVSPGTEVGIIYEGAEAKYICPKGKFIVLHLINRNTVHDVMPRLIHPFFPETVWK